MCVQQLRLVLYGHHIVDKDDKVGEAHIPVEELKDQAAEDVWVDLTGAEPEKSADQYKAIYCFSCPRKMFLCCLGSAFSIFVLPYVALGAYRFSLYTLNKLCEGFLLGI